MKKQKSTTVSLKFKKINIASINYLKGGATGVSDESNCCSKPPICLNTVTTRPDSLAPANMSKHTPD